MTAESETSIASKESLLPRETAPGVLATCMDPREILAFGAIFALYFVAVSHETLFPSWGEARAFHVLYLVSLAVSFMIWAPEFRGHVEWLTTSGFTARRGLGKWGSPLYGIFAAPVLSVHQFVFVLVALIGTLLASAYFPILTCVTWLLACFVMAHLFWNRQNIGGHGGLPVLHTLFCLGVQSLCSSDTRDNSDVTLFCIKLILAACYFGSALCKVVTASVIQRPRRWWGSAGSFKFYLLDSLACRPMGGLRQKIRDWILTSPCWQFHWLCMNGLLFFELSSPVLLWWSPRIAAFLLILFHYVTWVLVDIDFLSFWGPSLVLIAVQGGPVMGLFYPTLLPDFTAAFNAAPIQTAVVLAYTALQVFVSLIVYDLNPQRGEFLPFSAYPMFEEATVPFEEQQAMALIFRVPTKESIPEPYYLRMQALAPDNAQGDFISGPRVLDSVKHRTLIIGIPKRAAPIRDPEKYAGGVWRPQEDKKKQTVACDHCVSTLLTGVSKLHTDIKGEHHMNHERECAATQGSVIFVANLELGPAMPEVDKLLDTIMGLCPEDAWSPLRMRELIDGYDGVQRALEGCPRTVAYRRETR